jgi:hypothetical protein
MLSDLAVVRPAAPCLESTATQHDDNPGGDGEKQDVFQTDATRWHGQPLPAALCDSLIMTKTMAKKRDAIVAAALGSVLMLNADCPKRDARLQDRCDLVCRDLPKVL